jgi:hypothetical protein
MLPDTLRRIFIGITSTAIVFLVVLDVIRHDLSTTIETIEIGFLIVGFWFIFLGAPVIASEAKKSANVMSTKFLSIAELSLLVVSTFSILIFSRFTRPTFFFLLIASFYFLLFIEVQTKSGKLWPFILKLFFGQFLLIETFSFFYPSVFSTDSTRDLQIASLVIQHSGGLPANFVQNIWYDFSPIASLSYAVSKMISGATLINSEVMIGFVIGCLITLALGAIAFQITKNTQATLFSIWISSLVPFVWYYTALPIPEMFGLIFVLLLLLIVVKEEITKEISSYLTATLLVIATILTHGGIALELIGILIVLFTIKRRMVWRFVTYALIISLASYITYIVGVHLLNVPSGLTLLGGFLSSLFSPSSAGLLTVGANASSFYSVSSILQVFTGTFWWVFLGVLGWYAIINLLGKGPRLRESPYLIIFGIALLLLLFGTFLDLIGSAQAEGARYVSLLGYALLCVPASMVLISPLLRPRNRRVYVMIVVAFLVFAMISSPLISPDLWQNLGQGSSAQRFLSVTSSSELSSQLFLDHYDNCFVVVANYQPEFTNITGTCQSLYKYYLFSESAFSTVGVAGYNAKVNPPFVILYSLTKASLSLYVAGSGNPEANISFSESEIVYSSQTSLVSFMP